MTPTCLTPEQLRALLDDALGGQDGEALDHVDDCPACQLALDNLTRAGLPSALWHTLSGMIGGTATRAVPVAGAIPERVGPYRIERVLGRGGMGVVYLGRHARLGRPAAVKRLTAAGDATVEQVARFRREAEAMAAVRHPNILPVYEAGEDDGAAWIALEYAPRGTLRDQLRSAPLSAVAAAEVAEGVARGAAAAHALGILHRDIKPANVLLLDDPRDPRPVPKLADFGLARHIGGDRLTITGTALGTPNYMAPEVATGSTDTDGRAADIYAAGAVLYECLTGRPPFEGADPLAVIQQAMRDDPVPPSRLATGVPRDLETICLKCLEKEPRRRYSTADALADDLRRWLGGRPVSARRVGPLGRLDRLARRHPVPALLASLLVATGVAGGVGVTVAYRTAVVERGRAESAERETARQLAASRRQVALATLDKGQALAEAGDACAGVLWMAEALTQAPEGDGALDRLIRLNLAGWLPHTPRLVSAFATNPLEANFHPIDADSVAVARLPDTVTVYDLPSGRRRTPAIRHDRPGFVNAVGGRICAVSRPDSGPGDGIGLWDAATGRPLGEPLRPGPRVTGCILVPGRPEVLLSLADRRIVLIDPASHRLTREWQSPPVGDIGGLAATPDGSAVYAWFGVTGASSAWRFDLRTGQGAPSPLGPGAEQAAFSPDGRRLVTVRDRQVQLWDVRAGAPIGSPLTVGAAVGQISFSPDGRYVSLGSKQRVERLDTATGEFVATGVLEAIDGYFPLSQTRSLTRDLFGGTVRVWDVPSAGLARRPGTPATGFAPERAGDLTLWGNHPTAALDLDAGVAVVADRLGGGHAWDIRVGRPLPRPVSNPHQSCSAAAASADGKNVALSFTSNHILHSSVRLFDRANGALRFTIPAINWIRSMEFTADGRGLATAGYDRGIQVFDTSTGARLSGVSCGGVVLAFALSADARTAVVSMAHHPEGHALMCVPVVPAGPAAPLPVAKPLWTAPRPAFGENRLTLSADGTRVLATRPGGLGWADVRTGKPVGATVPGPVVNAVAASPDGRSLLVGGPDGVARLWDTEVGGPAGPPLTQPSAVWAVALRGVRALTAGGDGYVRVWDIPSGRLLGPPLVHGVPVLAVRFRDDDSFVSVGTDGSVREWRLPDPVALPAGEQRDAVRDRLGLDLDAGRVVARPAPIAPREAGLARVPHAERALDAEIARAWGAAAYHLAKLVEAAPAADRGTLLLRQARCVAHLGDATAADRLVAQAAESLDADAVTDWHHRLASECGRAEDWAAARAHADRVLERRPGDASALALRAEAKSKLSDSPGAAADVRAAVDAGMGRDYALNRAGQAANSGQWKLAADLLDRAADAGAPVFVCSVAALGFARAGDAARHARMCPRLVEWAARDRRLSALITAAEGVTVAPCDPAVASQLVEVVRARLAAKAPAPEVASLNAALGRLLVRAGRPDEAIAPLEASGDADTAVQLFLALAHAHAGHPDAARTALGRAQPPVAPRFGDWLPKAEYDTLRAEVEAALDPGRTR